MTLEKFSQEQVPAWKVLSLAHDVTMGNFNNICQLSRKAEKEIATLVHTPTSADQLGRSTKGFEIEAIPVYVITTQEKMEAKIEMDFKSLKYLEYDDNLNCPICQQPFLQPMTTICGHTFCKLCISECLSLSSSDQNTGYCPLDRTPIDASKIQELFPTPLVIANIVDDLQVHCLNQTRGCEWIGLRWESERHFCIDCGFTMVSCNRPIDEYERPQNSIGSCTSSETENACPEELTREQLPASMLENGITAQDHELAWARTLKLGADALNKVRRCHKMTERRFLTDEGDVCVHKEYSCRMCDQIITKVSESKHLDEECINNFGLCDLCDNDTIPMMKMAKHKSNCLKSGRFSCPAKKIGCKWVGTNELALDVHQSDKCQLSHLLPHMEHLESRIAKLTDENKNLQSQIHQIIGSAVQGKIRNLGYQEPIEEVGHNALDLKDRDVLLHLGYEIEHIKSEIDQKINPFVERELKTSTDRQNIMNGLVNDTFAIRDDLNLQRSWITNLRNQLNSLLFRSLNRPGYTMSLDTLLRDPENGETSGRLASDERSNLKL